ncbi:class I SAM-dependent methyltransferase [Sulfurimonas sp.]
MGRINSEKFYQNAIKKFGVTPRGVCWIDGSRQQLRFDIIFSFLPKDLSSFSIVDAGCGFGDFFHFLKEQNRLPKKYIGIDAVQEMCSIAKEKTKEEIIHANILRAKLPTADYYVCSGAMNILTKFETVLFIQNCFKASKKGFIFNVLYGNNESEIYNYLNKKALQRIADELGVKELIYEDNYLKNDITMSFLK